MWYKVKWIPPLFAAFNTVWPTRGKASDGTIGDAAHQAETSGHNPDDTAGSKAERSDADTVPEVRAADVTSALPGAAMYDVVQRVLSVPADRERFIYIICDGWIWRASNGWARERYSGTDLHYGHAHFSGHPDSDENGNPFTSILSFKEPTVTDFSPADPNEWRQAQRTRTIVGNLPTVPDSGTPAEVNGLAVALANIQAGISAVLSAPAPVELTDAQLDTLADKVAARLQSLRFVAEPGA